MTTYTTPPDVSNLTLHVGDTLTVTSGYSATRTTIAGGSETVLNGGTDNNTTIAHGEEFDYGTANYTTIDSTGNNGGYLDVELGGTSVHATINKGGVENVLGGTTTYTTINADGVENVDNGGTSTYTTINAFGVLDIKTGGTGNLTTINFDGVETVENGGTAKNTTISDGGTENDHGTTVSTTILRGGVEHVYSGGTAENTNIRVGGIEIVDVGGTASGVIFGPNGTRSGGTLELAAPTLLKGTVTNWSVGDVIDLLNTNPDHVTVTQNSSHTTLTVFDNGSEIASYSLVGQQKNTMVSVTSDGAHGTDLILTKTVGLGLGGFDGHLFG